ncbi:HD-GYP domain-containing protein [Clostridium tunisiense]|uniref:HD-GYP domain-containing protein n=1 Tax=Clostridium tunisiense TaxID=219748 RepID=UPI000302B2D4|nr:HD domain-containing phosphohydrolase [Clostridium tunisiense]
MNISLNKVVNALSISLDLAETTSLQNLNVIEDISGVNYSKHKYSHHSKRTAFIALEIGKKLNISEESYHNLYIASMLHDIGAQSMLDEVHTSVEYIKKHCVEGAYMIQKIPALIQIYDIILYHHENYDGSGCMKLKNYLIPFEAQIIRLADLLEVMFDENIPIYKQKDSLIDWIKLHSGRLFCPTIVDCFLNLASSETFWLNLYNVPHMGFILDYIAPKKEKYVTLKEFEYIAEIFATIIDSKSGFTAMHSRGIADLAFEVSKYVGYDENKCLKMKIAGLLHDIGKLAIPATILDKKDKLTEDEFSLIKSHTYYTKLILDRIELIPDISEWAANHHEKLNGAGYPRRLSAEHISEESKIIGVCDIYQALTEDRPYRKGMYMYEAFQILDDMVRSEFICGNAVKSLKSTLISKVEENLST